MCHYFAKVSIKSPYFYLYSYNYEKSRDGLKFSKQFVENYKNSVEFKLNKLLDFNATENLNIFII